MSQSQFAERDAPENHTDGQRPRTDEADVGGVLEAIDDADCRTILAATSDEELTVTEISDAFDIARSTAYRKVEVLVDAGLLEERVRIRSSGNHVSAYACAVEDLTLSIDGDSGLELRVTRTEEETAFASAGRRF
ncbi:helix-turn-helix domain-containing protein [Halosimplex aquaticum]|uniref:Helix-turn-helix domain-containing protein n=1 Tax=Halosimplex aquaticum TaxID=3026162 RepID=A0ABD5XUP1_9EURY|nr:helix-turn-helix domain-containing protein [Halosimplex aquaticum]